jgi:hypothetical protein
MRTNGFRALGVLLALGGLGGCTAFVERSGVAVLGYADDSKPVLWKRIGGGNDGLETPRDLAFNPERPDELWVVNRADDSVSIFFDAGTETQASEHIIDPYAMHFMEEVSSITFGAPGTFGTCQESRNTYNDNAQPNDFMGPTLWPSDLDIFGASNPSAVDYLTDLYGFPTDLGSHLDMLHQSPMCMGIAWERDNVYWVFDGHNGAITRNDFQEDHGPGFDDHSDGIIGRYSDAAVERVEGVPSHLVFDASSSLLYFVDTGNNRVGVLDTTSGEEGARLPTWEPGTEHFDIEGADTWTIIDGDDFALEQPSGLALVDGTLFVTDHGTGWIHAFTLEGEEIDALDSGFGPGALMGIEARSIDDLWLVHASDDQVWRLQPG